MTSPVKQKDAAMVYAIRIFAFQRLDMRITDAEAEHVGKVLGQLFEDAFHEGTQ